ncbi:hypothetical protein EJ110_NYTH26678 [Nymphaea thermarum]|nr:hypothetical protein EJ110_NYTH26678 [Nymphaea thermarum]
MDSLRQCHASLITSGLDESLHLQTKLVAMYSLLGSFDDGLIVFDHIKNPDSFSWKVLIQGCARNQLFSDVHWFMGLNLTRILKCSRIGSNLFCAKLKGRNVSLTMYSGAFSGGAHMGSTSPRKARINNVVFSMALKACVQLRFLDEGKQIDCDIAKVGGFDDVVAVGLINLYSECGDMCDAQKMFVEMPE